MPDIRTDSSTPTDARRRAALLVDLLGDDSPMVVARVRSELERMGKTAHSELRRTLRFGSARQRGRARQLLLDHARKGSVRRLIRYASRNVHDLEHALFLLDAHGAPSEDLRGFRKVLDVFADEVLTRLSPGSVPSRILTEYLGQEVGFAGATQDFHHPDNIYLHRGIERRTGMPLTLCAVYAFVARRAKITAELLPFPGHVLLAIEDPSGQTILDPFAGGVEVSEARIRQYLSQHGVPARPEYFLPASDSLMFLRHVTNLVHSCSQRGRHSEARELSMVQKVLQESRSLHRRG